MNGALSAAVDRYNTLHFALQSRVPNGELSPFVPPVLWPFIERNTGSDLDCSGAPRRNACECFEIAQARFLVDSQAFLLFRIGPASLGPDSGGDAIFAGAKDPNSRRAPRFKQ